jgi:hypothetical protein
MPRNTKGIINLEGIHFYFIYFHVEIIKINFLCTFLQGHIDKVLPSDCEIVVLYAPGIIINNEEMEGYLHPKVVCTFLPEIPNVTINTCQVSTSLHSIKGCAAFEELNKIISCAPKLNCETSTCLMIFCNYSGHEIASIMISAIKKR